MHPRKAASRTLLYLVLIVAAIYTLIPLVTIVLTAVRTPADLNQGPFTLPNEWRVIGNFTEAWADAGFAKYVINSVFITIPVLVMVVAFSTLSGYAFAKLRFPFRNLLFYLILLGMMVPFQAIMIPQYFLMQNLTLLNTRWAVVLAIGSAGLAFGTFMMRAFFVGISNDIIEQTKLDACSPLQTFGYVVLPLTFPAWTSLIIFQSMWAWNNLLIPLVYIYDDSRRPIPLGLMAFQDTYTTDYNLMSAAILISLIPLVVLYVLLQRRFTTGISMGAVKG